MQNENAISQTDIILKLNKMTIENRLDWKIYEGKEVGSFLGEAFSCRYKDWNIIIFKRRVVERVTSGRRPLVIRYRIAIVDLVSNKITLIKETQQALQDLYETINTKSSRFDEFIDNILKE